MVATRFSFGIGVTPSFPLHVNGTIRGENGLSLGGTAFLLVDAPGIIGGHLAVLGNTGSGKSFTVAGLIRWSMQAAADAIDAGHPKKAPNARFIILDNTPAGFPQREFLQQVVDAIPHEVTLAGNSNLAETMAALEEELKSRGEKTPASAPEIFVLIQGAQNFKKLRQEDEFSFSSSSSEASPAATLLNLITEGPARGIHVIITCDTYNNVSRFLGRKALSEFEMRVVMGDQVGRFGGNLFQRREKIGQGPPLTGRRRFRRLKCVFDRVHRVHFWYWHK